MTDTFVDAPPLHEASTYAHGVPYEYYRWLRDNDPIACLDHPSYQGEKLWVVTRYADVQRVSRDSASFHNAPDPFIDDGVNSPASGGSDQLMISLDAPDHMKLRKLINKGFTPRRVAQLGDMLRTRTNDIIDGLADGNSADLVHDLALTAEERAQAATDMFIYADAMCAERATDPRDDLMSVLLHAEVEGEKLTAFQIELFFMLLQNAGSETTRNLITTGTLALLQDRAQYDIVRNDLSVVPTAIEELLRFSTPVIHFTRTAAVGSRSRQASASSWSMPRPIAMSGPSPIPIPSMFVVTRMITSPSGRVAPTSVSGPISLVSRAGSCSRRSSPASTVCVSWAILIPTPGSTPTSSMGTRTCPSNGTRSRRRADLAGSQTRTSRTTEATTATAAQLMSAIDRTRVV